MNIRIAPLAAAAVIVSMSLVGQAADRKWQTGTWRDSGDARTYVIVATVTRLHLEDVTSGEKRALDAAVGTAVKFAIEGKREFVSDRRGAQHAQRLVCSVDLNY